MKEKTKSLNIDGANYRIGRFSPEVGTYILMQIMGTIARAAERTTQQASTNGHAITQEQPVDTAEITTEEAEKTVKGMTFAAFLNGLDFEAHKFIQKKCIEVCSRVETGTEKGMYMPMPIVGIPEVIDDMQTMLRLEIETLAFNFSDFLVGGGLRAIMGDQAQATVTKA